MKKQTQQLIDELFFTDGDGTSQILVGIRGSEAGLDHLELSVQSKFQHENGIKTIHKIYTTETEA